MRFEAHSPPPHFRLHRNASIDVPVPKKWCCLFVFLCLPQATAVPQWTKSIAAGATLLLGFGSRGGLPRDFVFTILR